MKVEFYVTAFFLGFFVIPNLSFAQVEEESAEVFLEEYSDSFQESFFEALKQKGIENYDKAINLLLKCKQVDGTNKVIDHELAKAYFASKNYNAAEEYAVFALNSEPENLWYLNTLIDILQKQGKAINQIKGSIPLDNGKLKENLALLYFQQMDYDNALKILNGIEKSKFAEELSAKIRDSLNTLNQSPSKIEQNTPTSSNGNSILEDYNKRMNELMLSGDYSSLEKLSAEAIEVFPVQPFFYYCNGLSLNKNLNYPEAIFMLETALDYWLEDTMLLQKIYEELVIAHRALGNTSKVNIYTSKIKSGL